MAGGGREASVILSDLANSVPTAANVDYYARIVEEKAILRRLIKMATQIATSGYTADDDVEEILSRGGAKHLGGQGCPHHRTALSLLKMCCGAYERIEMLHTLRPGYDGHSFWLSAIWIG